MAWTVPRTWIPGELVTASMLNIHLRDNLNILKTNIANDGSLVGAQLVLLKAGSGTNAAAGATNVDTIAMGSGLTALDRLLIIVHLGSTTQTTATPRIYNSTDSIDMLTISSLTAGAQVSHLIWASQRQTGATKVLTSGNTGSAGGSSYEIFVETPTTFTTNWTGAWTLALRHAGVTAGGTFDWSWVVLKVKGQ